ncbi:hypothetical protein [Streptomyces sp. TRM75561]|uniref:hypothetical protein n=1 Tax=Streptomyces sp. TRM75561 TaxID=2975269 RepID=UPI00244B3252|nr:hypothetical protein [Streptomyces sp. TRM75561]MDH3034189.1 hypothetical protein [Streptomyces sp. TRM75561]
MRGAPRAGDRLPDAAVRVGDSTERLRGLLTRPGVHLLLRSDAVPQPDTLNGPRPTALRLSDSPGRGLVAVRPDGHIGFRSGACDPEELTSWLALAGAVPPLSL